MNIFTFPYRLSAAIAAFLLLSACASSSRVDVNRKAPGRSYQVVSIINGPDQAGDVSAALEAALQKLGFKTRVNVLPPRTTVNLFSRTACHWSRVLRHAQVVEDKARPETEFAHQVPSPPFLGGRVRG